MEVTPLKAMCRTDWIVHHPPQTTNTPITYYFLMARNRIHDCHFIIWNVKIVTKKFWFKKYTEFFPLKISHQQTIYHPKIPTQYFPPKISHSKFPTNKQYTTQKFPPNISVPKFPTQNFPLNISQQNCPTLVHLVQGWAGKAFWLPGTEREIENHIPVLREGNGN